MSITIPRPEVTGAEKPHFLKHVCPPQFGGGPLDAPLGEVPDVQIERHLLRGHQITSMEGDLIDMWVIGEKAPPGEGGPAVQPPLTFPPLVRVKQGDLVYAHVGAHTNTHTIHWHGIEPSPYNDGVGKHSFEISGNFVYRWEAAEPGFYFYHCHKNTPHHFEMGLYGALIIDPPNPNGTLATPQPLYNGPKQTGFPLGYVAANAPGLPGFVGAPHYVVPYDIEAIWVSDDIDMDWHRITDHNAFMLHCDGNDPMNPLNFTSGGILNQFNPTYFGISGVVQRKGSNQNLPAPVAVTATAGQRILLRVLNAAYDIAQWTLPLDALVIAMDGRPLGGPGHTQYAAPFTIPKNTPFMLSTARRWDILVTAPFLGKRERSRVLSVKVEFFDYTTRRKHHTARTTITVNRA